MALIHFKDKSPLKSVVHDLKYTDKIINVIHMYKSYSTTLTKHCLLPKDLTNIIIEYSNENYVLICHSSACNLSNESMQILFEVVWKKMFNFIINVHFSDYDDAVICSVQCMQFCKALTITCSDPDSYDPEDLSGITFTSFILPFDRFDELAYETRMNIIPFFDCYMFHTYGIKNYCYDREDEDDDVCEYVNKNKYIVRRGESMVSWTITINDHKKLRHIIVITKMIMKQLNKYTNNCFLDHSSFITRCTDLY